MQKFILVKNIGELEVGGLKLLGASTKRGDDSKIGAFGSGIKYAIAYLLRENLSFRLYSGLKQVKFETKAVALRDQEFNQVLIDGEETSITTAWGLGWKQWQIFREIVANAIDEGGFSIKDVDSEEPPVAGETHFYIPYTEFAQFYTKLSNYFNLDVVNQSSNSLIPKDGVSEAIVYKKGVRVTEKDSDLKNSMYNYNLPKINLKEDRIADSWDIRYEIKELLTRLTDKDVIRKIYKGILNSTECLEVKLLTQDKTYSNLTQEWLEVLNGSKKKIISSSTKSSLEKVKGENFASQNNIEEVSEQFLELIERSFGTEFKNKFDIDNFNLDYQILETTKREQGLINMAVNKLTDEGLEVYANIKVVDFYDDQTQSMTEGATIILSRGLFDLGVYEVIQVILKESLRIKNGLGSHDTRKLSEVLLKVTTRLIMEKNI